MDVTRSDELTRRLPRIAQGVTEPADGPDVATLDDTLPLPRLIDHLSTDEANLVARRIGLMIHDGVVVQCEEGRIVWHNAVASRVLRMTSEELLGTGSMDPSWQSVDLDGNDLPGEEHPAMRAIATGQPVEREIMGVRAGDLSWCWLEVDSVPFALSDRCVVISVFRDITDRIEGRRELDEVLDHLQTGLIQTTFPDAGPMRFAAAYR